MTLNSAANRDRNNNCYLTLFAPFAIFRVWLHTVKTKNGGFMKCKLTNLIILLVSSYIGTECF